MLIRSHIPSDLRTVWDCLRVVRMLRRFFFNSVTLCVFNLSLFESVKSHRISDDNGAVSTYGILGILPTNHCFHEPEYNPLTQMSGTSEAVTAVTFPMYGLRPSLSIWTATITPGFTSENSFTMLVSQCSLFFLLLSFSLPFDLAGEIMSSSLTEPLAYLMEMRVPRISQLLRTVQGPGQLVY